MMKSYVKDVIIKTEKFFRRVKLYDLFRLYIYIADVI